jgi:pimeloyl-ACP methyl ester carboxylesterase
MATLLLVHSPLVGALTWSLVAKRLKERGKSSIVPALPDSRQTSPPYWQRHAEAVARAMMAVPENEAIVLVGHSGGGMILPAIREVSERPISAYIFVDAGIPQDGKSRLDSFGERERAEFRASANDGLLPTLSEEDLLGAISDSGIRTAFVAELWPLPLAIYEEPIPVFAGWPDVPCGYIQFTSTYNQPAEQTRHAGWAYRKLEGGHFLMLNNPAVVAAALIEMTDLLLTPNP